MIWFATFALLVWVPIVYVIFEVLPCNKAVVSSFVFAWLFLPPSQIDLSGVPDWSKMTATTFGVSLVACSKHSNRLRAFRFRWFDLPVLVYCVCPIASSMWMNQGIYDGLSAFLDEGFRWGLPYLVGRIFLGDARGNHLLCLGIAVGGLMYVPFCLFEIRMSPILKPWIYGFSGREALDYSMRYGGYRPIVFLSFGLELGWWMCCATLACYNLWQSGAVRQLRGYPMSILTVGMVLVTLACKSTGAIVLILFGFFLFGLARYTRKSILIWVLLIIPPMYCVCRPLGLWDGSLLINISATVFGPERTQSLGYRFEQEEILMRNAMEHSLFGWSRSAGFNSGPRGLLAVVDGLWMIVFGTMGVVGLVALNGMHLLPTILFMRRYRTEEWLEPDVAPTLTLAMILPLFMLDNLSNAMLNPIYAVAMGAVSGFVAQARPAEDERANRRTLGHDPGANGLPTHSRHRALAGQNPDQDADDYEAEAQSAASEGQNEAAWEYHSLAISCRQAAVDLGPSPDRMDRLARAHARFARFLTRINYRQFAVDQRHQAVQVWRHQAQRQPLAAETLYALGSNLNDLAWLLVSDPATATDPPNQASTFAEEAVQIAPEQAAYWNTLGIAYYRTSDHYKAIRALSRAVSLDDAGGNAFDFFYLALANQALGYAQPARDWLDHAEAWAARHPELAPALLGVRQEVASGFGAVQT